jgi:hypothetical protein
LPQDLSKSSAEGAKAAESNLETDIRDATVGTAQKKHTALDTSPL